jgi:Bax protein
MNCSARRKFSILLLLWAISLSKSQYALSQEVVVISGVDDIVSWLESENWWGEDKRGGQLQVPHAMITGFSDRWRVSTMKMPVSQKKEIFYRLMLPLVMHANTMVLARRAELRQMQAKLEQGEPLSDTELRELREFAVLLRIVDVERAESLGPSADELLKIIDRALYKLDVIPAGLVLGQAAYESGYGTSRFAVKGNALFGQWTYGGKGLVPEQQRKSLEITALLPLTGPLTVSEVITLI